MTITSLRAIFGILIFVAVGCSDAPKSTSQRLDTTRSEQNIMVVRTLVASDSPQNLGLITTAVANKDLAGIDAMEADGRLVLLQPGTKFDCTYGATGDEDSVGVVFVKSGKLIGRSAYAYNRAIQYSKEASDQARSSAREKAWNGDDRLFWIVLGGGLIELERFQREVTEVEKKRKKR